MLSPLAFARAARVFSGATACLLLSFGTVGLKAETALLENGGFEDGLAHWHSRDEMSSAVAEAARTGKLGLRVVDEDEGLGSSLNSSEIFVNEGDVVEVSFYANTDDTFLGVYLWPVDVDGRLIKASERGDLVSVRIEPTAGWEQFTFQQTMPEGVSAVSIWVHSWSSATGTASLDDFKITVTPATPAE
ncbi:carbohydrate binding domain-containing protein [Cerasicoccus maritimus]|uniref:carbohydrate binding domain-containing protein n=1 Tax=Cerasicoccus maritimus TaxID=490089 RepID=UPI0028528AB7|nr:carbohydrate binding domain-containing protein [Cerasicoccus maritimus]